MIEPAALSNITIIPAGSWLKPTMEIYCDDAQSWVQLGGEMQRFPKMHHAEDEATPGYGLEWGRN